MCLVTSIQHENVCKRKCFVVVHWACCNGLVCCAVPAVLPQVIVSSAGSSALKVQWNALHADQARGIITRHRLIYRRHGNLQQHTVDLPGDVYEYIISGTTLRLLLMFNGHCSHVGISKLVLRWVLLLHHLPWNRTLELCGMGVFHGLDFYVARSLVSRHWREHTALTPAR